VGNALGRKHFGKAGQMANGKGQNSNGKWKIETGKWKAGANIRCLRVLPFEF
jgi:hypothetical protein